MTDALTDGVTLATHASTAAHERPSRNYLGRTLYVSPSLTVGATAIT
jgi:hypothetical protein